MNGRYAIGVVNGNYYDAAALYMSSNTSMGFGFFTVRPVITLGPNVEIKASEGENSQKNPHIITQY